MGFYLYYLFTLDSNITIITRAVVSDSPLEIPLLLGSNELEGLGLIRRINHLPVLDMSNGLEVAVADVSEETPTMSSVSLIDESKNDEDLIKDAMSFWNLSKHFDFQPSLSGPITRGNRVVPIYIVISST